MTTEGKIQLRIALWWHVENVSFHGCAGVFPTFLQAELRCEVGLRLTGLLQGFQENSDVPVQEALKQADGES